MKTGVWSLAILASSAFAAPGNGLPNHLNEAAGKKACIPRQQPGQAAPTRAQQPSPHDSKSEVASGLSNSTSSTLTWSGSQLYSSRHNSSSFVPTTTSHASSYPSTSLTIITTSYTTVCPATQTFTIGGSTSASTYETISTITELITSTILSSNPSHTQSGPLNGHDSGNSPSSSNEQSSPTGNVSPAGNGAANANASPNGNAWLPSTTLTEITTIYTTVCPGTTMAIRGKTTMTRTYETTSIITSIYTSTITIDQSIRPTSLVTVPWGSTTFQYTVPVTLPAQGSDSPAPSSRGAPYPTGSHSTGTLASHTQSMSFPAGSTTTQSPGGTGTRPSHNVSSTSTSSCTRPTPTLQDSCIRCEGQPGDDQFCGYTEDDDWYQAMPKTCNTVEYWFNVENKTITPDGIPRIGLVVNGQMPGPTIHASWGDTIVVHLTNSLQNNGTSIHFHGMRQNRTNEMDGVPSITQCALAPGDTMTYTFKATNYGSSWYHSHFAVQTYEGVFGPVVIDGPTSQQYDDEQSIVLQDWSHITVNAMYDAAQAFPSGGPRTLDTGLINGMNVWGTDGTANATGRRFQMTVVQGKTYRLRIVNVAIQSTFKFYIDNHKFTVFANDFVAIQPYETTIVNINVGQRYDLLLKTDQPIGNYWMRSDNQNICAAITYADNIKGIVSYLGALPGTPTSRAYNYTPECVDEPYASLVPRVPLNAGATVGKTIEETVAVGAGKATPNFFKWTLSGTTFQSQWGEPTLQGIVNNASFDVQRYSGDLAITAPNLGEWVYIIIDSPVPLPHPIHLHGHDFLILAQGQGLYTSSVELNLINPPRRDVALMPWNLATGEGGHLVLAFQVDNPGAWPTHCHIGGHISMGFALQIIEAKDQIKKTVTNSCQMDKTCSNWHSYAKSSVYDVTVNDSGV